MRLPRVVLDEETVRWTRKMRRMASPATACCRDQAGLERRRHRQDVRHGASKPRSASWSPTSWSSPSATKEGLASTASPGASSAGPTLINAAAKFGTQRGGSCCSSEGRTRRRPRSSSRTLEVHGLRCLRARQAPRVVEDRRRCGSSHCVL